MLRFGPFEVRLDTGELLKGGRKLRLQEKSFRVLAALLERPGSLVTREELTSRLWPDGVFVDIDHGLNAAVNRLRAALGDSAETPRYIETLPRRGYRFLGSVEGGEGDPHRERRAAESSDSFEHLSGVVRLRELLENRPELTSGELRGLPAEVAAILERLTEGGGSRTRSIRRLASLLKAFHSPDGTEPPNAGQDASAPGELEVDLARFVETLRDEAAELAPYVPRDAETERLDAALGDVLAGRGRIVFVTGEPGAGKSTLLRAFARRALETSPDVVVACGHASPEPFLAFRELFGLLTGDMQVRKAAGLISFENAVRLSSLLPHAVRCLLKVAPDLVGGLLPGEALLTRASEDGLGASERRHLKRLIAGKPGGKLEDAQKASLFEQCTQFLIELSRKRPLVLVLEDLHWADPATVSLLFHLGRRIAGYPILILGSFRSFELTPAEGERHPLESAAHELQSQLGPLLLPLEGSRELTNAIADKSDVALGREEREELFRLSQGNPMFVAALVDEWKDGIQNGLPSRIEAVLAERVASLPPRLRRLLDLASVEGDDFVAEAVARADETSEREVVQLLSGELDKRRAIVSASDLRRVGDRRISIYRFRHPLLRSYLYRRLDDVERSYLHEALGHALQGLAGDGAPDLASRAARHFEAAGLV